MPSPAPLVPPGAPGPTHHDRHGPLHPGHHHPGPLHHPGQVALLALVALAPLACSDDAPEPAALGEVCGHTGPTRLLELAPGHRLSAGTVPLTLGDRHVFRTAELDPASGEFHLEGIVDLWSTGPCGESPRQLLSYVQWISTLNERWPATIIACDGGLKSVDVADGTVAPFLLTYWCGSGLTDHGLLLHNSGISTGNSFAALSLRPYPDQPRGEAPPPRKLHPKLRTQILEPVIVLPDYLRQVRADAVFAIDEHDTLVRIDLVDASVTEEATNVFAFEVSPDGRHLIWQLPPPPDLATGLTPVFLKDRATGTTVSLGEGSVIEQPDPRILATPGFAILSLDRRQHTSVIRLSDLSITELPRGFTLAGAIDERDLLISNYAYLDQPGLARLDSATGTLTPLVQSTGDLLSFTPARAFYLARDHADPRSEGPVYRIDFADDTPVRVAARATQFAQLRGDTQLVTAVDIDADDHATLVLVDLATTHESRIATQVPPGSFQLGAILGPDHLVYSVDDGDRSGIYIARLPDE